MVQSFTGATGLLRVLSEDWLTFTKRSGKIEWKKNHSRNTQLALLQGEIDIAFTYERDQEELAASEGWSDSRGCAFHDHFCLAGPAKDPAKIKECRTIGEALQRIARSKHLFHSRIDTSATMWKEQELWTSSGSIRPWEGQADWFKTSLLGPKDALIQAAQAGAYLLTDRSTLLHETMVRTVTNVTVFFEPTSSGDVLMNSCHMLARPEARNKERESFIEYIKSTRAQKIIADYGRKETGRGLFAPIESGYAKDKLKGGHAENGKWVDDREAKL